MQGSGQNIAFMLLFVFLMFAFLQQAFQVLQFLCALICRFAWNFVYLRGADGDIGLFNSFRTATGVYEHRMTRKNKGSYKPS